MSIKENLPKVDYSIVIPAYNEEENLTPLLERIKKVMALVSGSYEVIVVDNGSYDSTPALLEELINTYPWLVVVTLSRNFGYEGAIAAGFEYVCGSWIIVMDGDQQDPPEVIPEFINKAKEGYDIVYGIRAKRTEGWFLGFQMKLFYRIWKAIVNFDIPRNAGNFAIISRRVLDIINGMPERNKFIRGLRAWTGYPSTGIVYQRDSRTLGKTKFSLLAYVNHALNAITSFSAFPLRVFSYLGGLGLLACFLLGSFLFLTKVAEFLGWSLLNYTIPRGATTIALLVLGSFSINLLGLGILGEYIGRILEEVKGRPNFLVRKVIRNGKSVIDDKAISK